MKVKIQPIEARIQELVATGKSNLMDFNPMKARAKFNEFVFDFNFEPEALKILESAYKSFYLSPIMMERIERICLSIMQFEKLDKASPAAIAETLQYVLTEHDLRS